MARDGISNEKCIQQNTPLFGFIPIYGLQSRVYNRNENNICQNIIDLHTDLRKDGRHNYVGLQVLVQSKLNAENGPVIWLTIGIGSCHYLSNMATPLISNKIAVSVMI